MRWRLESVVDVRHVLREGKNFKTQYQVKEYEECYGKMENEVSRGAAGRGGLKGQVAPHFRFGLFFQFAQILVNSLYNT